MRTKILGTLIALLLIAASARAVDYGITGVAYYNDGHTPLPSGYNVVCRITWIDACGDRQYDSVWVKTGTGGAFEAECVGPGAPFVVNGYGAVYDDDEDEMLGVSASVKVKPDTNNNVGGIITNVPHP